MGVQKAIKVKMEEVGTLFRARNRPLTATVRFPPYFIRKDLDVRISLTNAISAMKNIV